MGIDATKIHQGPGKLWLDCEVPTSGNRLVIDATGTPTAGSPIMAGATEGAATSTLTPKYAEVGADQVSSPIDVVMDSDAYEIDLTIKQSDLALLTKFFPPGSFSSGTDGNQPEGAQNYEQITFGGIIAVPKRSVAVISPRRDVAGKFVISQLYSCYQAEAIKLAFARGKETTYGVKLKGLADPSRTVGDQVGMIWRQV